MACVVAHAGVSQRGTHACCSTYGTRSRPCARVKTRASYSIAHLVHVVIWMRHDVVHLGEEGHRGIKHATVDELAKQRLDHVVARALDAHREHPCDVVIVATVVAAAAAATPARTRGICRRRDACAAGIAATGVAGATRIRAQRRNRRRQRVRRSVGNKGGWRGGEDVPLGSAAAVHAPSSRIATARFVPLAAARTRAPRGRRGRTHSALQPPQPPPPPPRANAAASATSTPSATPAAKDRQPAPCGGTDAPAIAAWRAPRAAPAARCGPASAPHPAVPRPRAHADCDRSAEVQQHRTKKKKFARNE